LRIPSTSAAAALLPVILVRAVPLTPHQVPSRWARSVGVEDKYNQIINLPPRHLNSHLASVAALVPPVSASAQILCVNYSRPRRQAVGDCRRVVAKHWYRHLFATRLSPQRQARLRPLANDELNPLVERTALGERQCLRG